MIPPFFMPSEALRAAQTGPLRAGWVFPHPARIDRRRAAQRGLDRDRVQREMPRLSEALRLPYFRPTQANSRTNSETGSTGPLRDSQGHSERSAEQRSARRPTEMGGAGRQIRAGPRLSGAGLRGPARGSPEAIHRGDAVQDFGLYTTQLSTAAS